MKLFFTFLLMVFSGLSFSVQANEIALKDYPLPEVSESKITDKYLFYKSELAKQDLYEQKIKYEAVKSFVVETETIAPDGTKTIRREMSQAGVQYLNNLPLYELLAQAIQNSNKKSFGLGDLLSGAVGIKGLAK